MDRLFGDAQFTSIKIEDYADGYVGYELLQLQGGKQSPIARIVFWDATGQFAVETLGSEVPLTVLEELIAEARENIKTG